MKPLPTNLRLSGYQAFVKEVSKQRDFNESLPESFMLLVEEVGELAKAAREHTGIKTDKSSKNHDLEDEAADVLFLLLYICNMLNIDLQKSFSEKEKKNRNRKWE